MDFTFNNSFLTMERSMDFLWAKQAAVLDNISNAETPNYKAKYLTFEESLEQKLQAALKKERPIATVRDAVSDFDWEVHEAAESTRMDGNGVNVTEQSLEAVRNAFQLQYTMNAISADLTRISRAING